MRSKSVTKKYDYLSDLDVNDQIFILGSFNIDSLLYEEIDINENEKGLIVDTSDDSVFVKKFTEKKEKGGDEEEDEGVLKINRDKLKISNNKNSTNFKKIFKEPVPEMLKGLNGVNVSSICMGGFGHRLLLTDEGKIYSVKKKKNFL